MNKIVKIAIIVILLLFLIGGFTYFTDFNQNKTIEIGKTTFSIPENYYKGNNNNLGAINLTNGTNSLFILEHETTDLHGYLVNYTDYVQKDLNQSVKVTCSTVENSQNVYKVEKSNDTQIIHYFFVRNGKTYEIYTWDGNSQTDMIVENMIKSIN